MFALLAAPALSNVAYAATFDASVTAQSDLPTPPRLASMGIDLAAELSVLPELLPDQASDPSNTAETANHDVMPHYQSRLPHPTQPNISQQEEKLLLQLYLNHPNDVALCRYFAVYHLYELLLGKVTPGNEGFALGHTIIALSFLKGSIGLARPSRGIHKRCS